MSKNLYHEIKNHLSVCDLYVEIISKTLEKKGITDEVLTRAVKTIKNSLGAIGAEMIELRAQTGEVKFSEINLFSLTEDVFSASLAYVDNKNIEFINNLPLDYSIKADKNKMFSVFVNLAKNAVEAIKKEGYVKISAENGKIIFENNGEDISESVAKHIFDDGFTTKETGSGIGLAAVKEMLNKQNFDILLDNSIHGKTRFIILNH